MKLASEGSEATNGGTDSSAATEPCDATVVAIEICACEEFTLDLTPLLERARSEGVNLTRAIAMVYPDGPTAYGERLCAGGYRQPDTVGSAAWDSDGPNAWWIPTTDWAGLTMVASVQGESGSPYYLAGNGSAPSGDFLTAIAQVASGLVA